MPYLTSAVMDKKAYLEDRALIEILCVSITYDNF